MVELCVFCVLLIFKCIFHSPTPLTRSSIHHLRFELFALILQRLDFTFLGKEEVGSHGLAHDQNAGQQGDTCHFVGTTGAAAARRACQDGRLKCLIQPV